VPALAIGGVAAGAGAATATATPLTLSHVVAIPGSKDDLAFGDATGGYAIRLFTGTAWKAVSSPGSKKWYLLSIAAGSTKAAWVVGNTYNGSQDEPLVAMWRGKSFATQKLTGYSEGQLNGVAASSPSNAWLIGDGEKSSMPVSIVDRWTGRTWVSAHFPTLSAGRYPASVATSGPTDVWVLAGDLIYHWNGKKWSKVPTPDGTNGYPNTLVTVGAKNAFAGGEYYDTSTQEYVTAIWHWNGKTWTTTVLGVGTAEAVLAAGGGTAWYLGIKVLADDHYAPRIMRWTGHAWASASVGKAPNPYASLQSIAVNSSTDGVAVGIDSPVLCGSGKALTYVLRGHAWKADSAPVPARPSPRDIPAC
jgi:hypothetical protein